MIRIACGTQKLQVSSLQCVAGKVEEEEEEEERWSRRAYEQVTVVRHRKSFICENFRVETWLARRRDVARNNVNRTMPIGAEGDERGEI